MSIWLWVMWGALAVAVGVALTGAFLMGRDMRKWDEYDRREDDR